MKTKEIIFIKEWMFVPLEMYSYGDELIVYYEYTKPDPSTGCPAEYNITKIYSNNLGVQLPYKVVEHLSEMIEEKLEEVHND